MEERPTDNFEAYAFHTTVQFSLNDCLPSTFLNCNAFDSCLCFGAYKLISVNTFNQVYTILNINNMFKFYKFSKNKQTFNIYI